MDSIKKTSGTDSDLDDPAPSLVPGLYVTATPIGNLGDITGRAIEVLSAADIILCEDTRITTRLLNRYDIKTKCRPYMDHNARESRPQIIRMIKNSQAIALVSDAGTPLISDPGYKLVREVRDAGLAVFTVPGASALIAALSIAGAPTDKFTFGGFLPPKKQARCAVFETYRPVPGSLVFYETANRLLACLRDCETILGDRRIAIARELTKRYEELREGSIRELIDHYTLSPTKGEIVIIIYPAAAQRWDSAAVDQALLRLLRDKSHKDAARELADHSGHTRRELYQRALELEKTST